MKERAPAPMPWTKSTGGAVSSPPCRQNICPCVHEYVPASPPSAPVSRSGTSRATAPYAAARDRPGALTIGTGRAERALQRLLDALARHDDEAEVVIGKNLRRRLVVPEGLLQGLQDALPVATLLHVYEVEDEDAAEVAQANLARNLFDRLHV